MADNSSKRANPAPPPKGAHQPPLGEAPQSPLKGTPQSPPKKAPPQSPLKGTPQSPPRTAPPQSPPKGTPQSPSRETLLSPPKRAPQTPLSGTPLSPPKGTRQSPSKGTHQLPPQSPGPAAEIDTNIEADPDFDDDGLDDELSTFTQSLTSSVMNFPTEYGRQYHAYRAGAYNFPNDMREMERLDMSHVMLIRATGGELYLAPIDKEKVQNVLDIGTGPGSWAVEMGDLLPQAEVRNSPITGNDLSPVQTNWVPPNVRFEVDDVESEWAYDFKFDFIFSRYMAASIADWPQLVGRIYQNLIPGGWAEFQDYDCTYRSDDGTLTPNLATYGWAETLISTVEGEKIGRSCRPGPSLKKWACDAGFINVQEKVVKIPIGPWPRDPLLKEVGMMNLAQLLEGLEGLSMKPFAAAGYTEPEIYALAAKVRSELKSKALHVYCDFYVVYGQKPA